MFKLAQAFLLMTFMGQLKALAGDIVDPSLGLTQVSISLKNQDLPANDLVYKGNPQYPTQQDAFRLRKEKNVDLSTLQPKAPSDIWQGSSTVQDEAFDQTLGVNSGDETNFTGQVMASTGNFKFIVQPQNNLNKSYMIQISRTLHTHLLRKELLRRLGYKIPQMKYLSQLKVQFPDQDTRDNVLIQLIPKATTGASSRWCYVQPEALIQNKEIPCKTLPAGVSLANPNEVLFQDMIVTEATPLIYNVTTPPINTASLSIITQSRTLRALSLAYGLVDAPESINQMSWSEGRVDSGNIKFVLPDVASFNCTLDDARWILNRISSLSTNDFVEIVNNSYYPPEVAKLLTQKLIARRNSLLNLFNVKHVELAFDPRVGGVAGLKNGTLTSTSWPQYGSNFAFGEQDSPLKDLQYYFYSLVETNAFANLINKFNAELPALSIAEGASENAYNLQQQAAKQFLLTGKTQQISFGTWHTPVVNGGISLNRSIVFGTYMGTSQLVQLADNYGFGVNMGLFVGTNGVLSNELLSGMVNSSMNISYTHLRPVTNLKLAFQEPMKNIYVPNLLRHISKEFGKLEKAENLTNTQADEINKDMAALKEYLAVGDSLIVAQNVSGAESVNFKIGDFMTPLVPQLVLSPQTNEVSLSRIHIYRKDEATIQVYKDQGELVGTSLSMTFMVGFPVSFPVAKLTAERVAGAAHTRISSVNVSTDIKHNPNFFKSAAGLQAALSSGSTEVLESTQKPSLLDVQFVDDESSFRFFHWAHRTLSTTGHIHVTSTDGAQANYLELSSGSQSGKTYQSLANDVASYVVSKLTQNGSTSIQTPTAPNPGQTFLGSSHTREVEFQGRMDAGVNSASVQIQYRWEGWKIKTLDVLNLLDQQRQKYNVKFFDDNFLQDTRDIQMYQIAVDLTIYHQGILNLLKMNPKALQDLQKKYSDLFKCELLQSHEKLQTADSGGCYHLHRFISDINSYQSGKLDPDHQASVMKDVISEAESFLDFSSLAEDVGGAQYFYLTSQVSGFREGSETMSQPLGATHTLGTQDLYFPQGVISYLQNQVLGIDDGEFKNQWLRDTL